MSTELFIVMLSVDLVAHLRVCISKKVAVVACFAPRLLVAAAALVRAIYLYQVTPHGSPEFDLWSATICTQVHVCASICTACIPYMVPFFKSLQANVWRSCSTRSWTARPRSSHTLGRSSNRLRKREANMRFESPRLFTSLIKEPERVSIISPRIPSPGPISPFLPSPVSTLQITPTTTSIPDTHRARTLSVVGTIYDSDSDEVFDMVSLQTAMCFAPSLIEPPAQARLSSTATMDVPEPFEYLALLGSPDPSSLSSCYSSRISTPTRLTMNPRYSLFPQGTSCYVPLQLAPQSGALSGRQSSQSERITANRVATSHKFDDFAHPVRSASFRLHPKFSTTPRLHAPPPTIVPIAESSHS
ncbi:uncharacterized protein M421DRAFT_424155 [Didymella exigua CBS 183.55]|uniref:Rhodopsin domain-containing protein n=1 Tax=Didymella exigua CBS 183.55 TaxID=1150837 RepID=A0A6A5RF34_9PLEO|nr:uncharacterized protein M421DRAFT_424155 [Didymella exigua CBS 183.55]KAF1925126.1 hypothetical protein M421DRAFT_424155 [Didymella exigua CBS 183.55]